MRLGVSDEQVAAAFVDLNGSRAAVAAMTGVLPQNISRALGKPHVIAEIRRLEEQRLVTEGLPAAINCLLEITTNKKAPAGARVMAAKVLLDRTLGGNEGAAGDKPDHELTSAEIVKRIEAFEAMAAARAANVTPATPTPTPTLAPVDHVDLFG